MELEDCEISAVVAEALFCHVELVFARTLWNNLVSSLIVFIAHFLF